jgi:hypothetical protein
LGWVAAAAAAGTAGALAADRALGGVDGRPALHLLIVLALPVWDALPARPGPRVLALAALVAAVAASWLLLADLRPEVWWRAQVSFGLACALAGTVQVLLSVRAGPGRTVER